MPPVVREKERDSQDLGSLKYYSPKKNGILQQQEEEEEEEEERIFVKILGKVRSTLVWNKSCRMCDFIYTTCMEKKKKKKRERKTTKRLSERVIDMATWTLYSFFFKKKKKKKTRLRKQMKDSVPIRRAADPPTNKPNDKLVGHIMYDLDARFSFFHSLFAFTFHRHASATRTRESKAGEA